MDTKYDTRRLWNDAFTAGFLAGCALAALAAAVVMAFGR